MEFFRPRKTVAHAKTLRKNMTQQERHLWYDFLRQYPVRFRRQEVIGGYIADFYCDKACLVIEVDGSQHYEGEGQKYDEKRTQYFEGLGLQVMRFSNRDIQERFEGVCWAIHQAVVFKCEKK